MGGSPGPQAWSVGDRSLARSRVQSLSARGAEACSLRITRAALLGEGVWSQAPEGSTGTGLPESGRVRGAACSPAAPRALVVRTGQVPEE